MVSLSGPRGRRPGSGRSAASFPVAGVPVHFRRLPSAPDLRTKPPPISDTTRIGFTLSAPNLVAIVDDDVFLRDALDNLLRSAGFGSRTFASAESFLERTCMGTFGLVVTDYEMTGLNGIGLIAAMRQAGDATPVIVMSGRDDPGLASRAVEAGAVDFINKPFDADDFVDLVERSIVKRPSDRNGAA